MNTKPEIADPATVLAELLACRKAMVDILRTVHPMGVAYHGASMVIAASTGWARCWRAGRSRSRSVASG